MKTGNVMIDQFVPWYFGIAFAFIFTYNTGFPDMPAFTRRPRYRRSPDAPRIETELWVSAMSRRIEGSVSRDWNFGFLTCLFPLSGDISKVSCGTFLILQLQFYDHIFSYYAHNVTSIIINYE